MKLSKFEKVVLSLIVALLVVFLVSMFLTFNAIDEAGGIKQVIIEAGKEVKEISKEINK